VFGGGGFRIVFDSVTGRWYDVLCKDDLMDPNDWLPLTNDWPGTGEAMEYLDPTAISQRFYRIRVKQP
jgi:hypothetical protein